MYISTCLDLRTINRYKYSVLYIKNLLKKTFLPELCIPFSYDKILIFPSSTNADASIKQFLMVYNLVVDAFGWI